jgi:hypothetical protein
VDKVLRVTGSTVVMVVRVVVMVVTQLRLVQEFQARVTLDLLQLVQLTQLAAVAVVKAQHQQVRQVVQVFLIHILVQRLLTQQVEIAAQQMEPQQVQQGLNLQATAVRVEMQEFLAQQDMQAATAALV